MLIASAVASALAFAGQNAIAENNIASLVQERNTVALSALPREAQNTYHLIRAGGPFPYSKDGIVFGNREHLLPRKAHSYYHEYTVDTPGASDRGARRMICGGRPPTKPEICYYTADHYASFVSVAP
ncbi:MAG: ribonuclease [Burkholderiaceae bacterium]|nr:ribonuclease [Burkholderiaceae bacterium]